MRHLRDVDDLDPAACESDDPGCLSVTEGPVGGGTGRARQLCEIVLGERDDHRFARSTVDGDEVEQPA